MTAPSTGIGRRAVCALLPTGIVLSACAPGSGLPLLPDYKPQGYYLGAGDEVRVITYDEDQLTGDFRLDDQGNIAVPLLGTIHAGGRTTEQLAGMIGHQLEAKNLLRNPSVSVQVRSYRPIFVLGEVARPGQYPYQPGMTMLTAVAVAGGFTYRAIQGYASVVRTRTGQGQAGQADTGRVLPQSFIAPGDVINVFERYF